MDNPLETVMLQVNTLKHTLSFFVCFLLVCACFFSLTRRFSFSFLSLFSLFSLSSLSLLSLSPPSPQNATNSPPHFASRTLAKLRKICRSDLRSRHTWRDLEGQCSMATLSCENKRKEKKRLCPSSTIRVKEKTRDHALHKEKIRALYQRIRGSLSENLRLGAS